MSDVTWKGRRCKVEGGTWMLSAAGEPENFDTGRELGGREAVAGSFPGFPAGLPVEMVPLPDDGPLLLSVAGVYLLLDGPSDDCKKWMISPLHTGKPDGDEPADSTWAEAVGFEWADEPAMYKYVGTGRTLQVVLTGDLAECEKDRHLSLYWTNYPDQPQYSGSLSVDDNPTRDRVRLLFAGLGEPLEEKEGAT